MFFLRHHIQIGSGAHPAFYEIGTGVFTRAVREADHSPPSGAEDKKLCSYTSTPPYVLIAY